MLNMTNVTDADNFYDMFYNLNQLSGNLIGLVLLVSIFLILVISLRRYDKDFKEILLTSSFITSVSSAIMLGLGFISWQYAIIPIIMTIGSVIIYQFAD